MKKSRFKETLIIELNIDKEKFLEKFSLEFEHAGIGFISELLKSLKLQKPQKTLIGKLENDTFQVKRNSSMNSFNYATAIATGKVHESNNGIIVKTTIKGFNYGFIPLYIILGIVFLISFIGMFHDFQFTIGIIFSAGIFLYTQNNMLKDLIKLKKELAKKIKTTIE